MKSFYINLDRANERRAHMEKQARRLDLDLERIPAIDGAEMTGSESAAVCPGPGRSHQLSKIEVACFLSHRRAWQRIVEGNESHGAVFEDDLLFSSSMANYLNVSDWIPASCDVIKIETIARPILLSKPVFSLKGARKLWRLTSPNMGGGGYILSTDAARFLLSETLTFRDPVDHILFHPSFGYFDRLGIFQMVPALCIQQVRTTAVFLGAGAATSQMDGNRGVVKRHGLSKLVKEITRPFEQAGRRLLFGGKAFVTGGRYGSVPMR